MSTSHLVSQASKTAGNIERVVNAKTPISRAIAAMSLVSDAKTLADKAREWHENRTTWSITVKARDTAYRLAEDWFMERIEPSALRDVDASSVRFVTLRNGSEVSYEDYRNNTEMYLANPGLTPYNKIVCSVGSEQTLVTEIDGYSVTIKVFPGGSNNSGPKSRGSSDFLDSLLFDDTDSSRSPRGDQTRTGAGRGGRGESEMIFYTRSSDAHNAVLHFLNEFTESASKTRRIPTLYVADQWGDWSGTTAPRRELETVITRDGLVEDIKSDLQQFLADEQMYIRLGLPWHRGYLLSGPPGTGKTSLVKALASDMSMDLWYLSMGDIKEDTNLISLVRGVRNGILLIEDIDSFAPMISRDEESKAAGKETGEAGVSTSALLNALDGVTTPHGLIVIMTTNYLDRIDNAILRSGRADRIIELPRPLWGEIQRLWAMFYPEEAPLEDEPEWFTSAGGKISQADVSEVIKRNWKNASTARETLLSGVWVGEHLND